MKLSRRWLRLPKSRKDLRALPKWLWVAVSAGVLLAVVSAWLWLRTLRPVDPTWARIQTTGILRVCTDPSWLPFESVDPTTGRIEGFDADLARLLAARLASGVRAEFITVGFDSLYDALLANRCDAALSALPYDPTRTEDVGYSLAYFNAGMVQVVREGASDMVDLDNLSGRVVGVEWGFVPEGHSRQRLLLSSLNLRRYDTTGDALRALQSGEVDAALVDRISALTFLQQCQGLQIVGKPITDVNYVIPVRPDSVLLLKELNRVLLEMRQDGTLSMLQEKWF